MLLGKHYLFLFPNKTHKKCPSQLDKFIFQPGIPLAFKSLDPKRPNKSDKTGTKQVFSASAITLTSRRMFGRGMEFLFFSFFFFSRLQSSEFLQPSRIEMLEKVSNSQAKPLSITKFPSQLIETPVFLSASKIPLGNR